MVQKLLQFFHDDPEDNNKILEYSLDYEKYTVIPYHYQNIKHSHTHKHNIHTCRTETGH